MNNYFACDFGMFSQSSHNVFKVKPNKTMDEFKMKIFLILSLIDKLEMIFKKRKLKNV